MIVHRFVAQIAYDGTNYEGFHTQRHGNTIQNILERRLSNLLDTRSGAGDDFDNCRGLSPSSSSSSSRKTMIRVVPAGRTDSGVHAKCQIVHFDVGISSSNLKSGSTTDEMCNSSTDYSTHDDQAQLTTTSAEPSTTMIMPSLSLSHSIPIIGPSVARHIRTILEEEAGHSEAAVAIADAKDDVVGARIANVLEQTLIADSTKFDHKIKQKDKRDTSMTTSATMRTTLCTVGDKRIPPDIQVLKVWHAAAIEANNHLSFSSATHNNLLFHSRRSCVGKRYVYTIQESASSSSSVVVRSMRYRWVLGKNQRLDVGKMKDAARKFIGVHDFRNFGVIEHDDRRTPIKKMRRLDVQHFTIMDPVDQAAHNRVDNIGGSCSSNFSELHPPTESIITITAECDRFLYNMMRMISGSLVQVGLGRMTPEDIESLLLDPIAIDDSEKQQNGRRGLKHGILKAPAHGLCLHHCFYEPEESTDTWMDGISTSP